MAAAAVAEGVPLTFAGKVNRLAIMVRGNLAAAMQGLVALPLLAGYDTRLVPLHRYFVQAMDLMWSHLKSGARRVVLTAARDQAQALLESCDAVLAMLDQPAEVHHADPVAHLGDDAEIVGDEQQALETHLGPRPEAVDLRA